MEGGRGEKEGRRRERGRKEKGGRGMCMVEGSECEGIEEWGRKGARLKGGVRMGFREGRGVLGRWGVR